MTDKYSQVLALLDTFKSVGEISQALGWNKATTQHYVKRLGELGYVEKIIKNCHGHPYIFKRLIDKLPAEHIENLHNRKCKHKSEIIVDSREINAMYNGYLFGLKEVPQVAATTREIKENYSYSEKKQSPRVYVGCSFNQVGW
jgi:predicted transcriptional regulator